MNNNNNPQIETITCKAILLGESGIGKTCIIRRLCTDSYDSNSIATVGSSCSVKVIEYPTHQRIKFEVWDTAGQESYRSLNKIFYRDAKIVILVYDITNRKSFDELQHYWARQLDSTCLNCSIIGIAANKSDLFDKEQIQIVLSSMISVIHLNLNIILISLSKKDVKRCFKMFLYVILDVPIKAMTVRQI